MRNSFAAVFAAVTLLTGATAALAAAPAPGTVLTGTLGTTLDSKSAYVGEDVAINNVSSSDGSIRDATLTGTVAAVQHAGQGTPGKIQLQLNTLHLPNGRTYAVDTTVTQMQANTKNNTLKEVGGGLAGMLVGNAIGKTLFGASGGGLVGLAGGFLIAKNNKTDVTIPANSTVSVQVVGSRRQAGY